MEERLKVRDAEQASWGQERSVMADGIRNLNGILIQQESSFKKLTDESAGWEKQCRRAKKAIERQKADIVAKDTEIKQLREALSGMGQTLEQTKQLLEARTEENKVAQAFMTTADHFSIADVSRLVDQLNDEIFQCAMDMSDAVLKDKDSSPSYSSAENEAWQPRFEEACTKVAEILGEDSVSALRAGAEKGDLILFECFAQTLFVYRCSEVVHRFSMENDEVNHYIGGLWGHVFESRMSPPQLEVAVS